MLKKGNGGRNLFRLFKKTRRNKFRPPKIMLNKLFEKYTGVLRNFKLVYVVHNFLNRRKLAANRKLYQKFGLKKSILAPLGSKDFRGKNFDEIPWLDQSDALKKLAQHPDFQKFSEKNQAAIRHFVDEGYLVLENFYTEKEVADLNLEIENLLKSGKATFNYTGRKIMELPKISDMADCQFFKNQELLQLLGFLLGRKVVPFHSINFIKGSEQRAHSDSIHMTTAPEGFLIATWTALEATSSENGALIIYPKSHRLPYLMTPDYDSGNTFLTIGNDSNAKYEDKIEEILQENHFEKRYFNAKPGDVLIWHANLIHGGGAIGNPNLTRKSMVNHYFGEGVICYHEISQRPAILG